MLILESGKLVKEKGETLKLFSSSGLIGYIFDIYQE
jgi:hypothetical protein